MKLLQIIADNKGKENTHEKNILVCFNNDVNKSDSYHKIDKLIGRFLTQGRFYPYEKLSFTEFEKCIGDTEKIAGYLRKMQSACDEIIDSTKLNSLVYTLLAILRQDSSIKEILYGSEFISKDKLFGSYATPKRICVEALLLGLLYHVHKNPNEAEKTELFDVPARREFQAVRFSDKNSLDFELPIGLIENVCEGARHQKSAHLKYRPELLYENEQTEAIPKQGNVFIYGAGGAGKSTLLMNQIRNENTINFYLPLNQYRREIHEKIILGNCWILLNILLKYHYQYEYQTYESCAVCVGADIIMRQMALIDRELKADPDNLRPKYILLLDGMNEMPSALHEAFVNELKWIINEWKNVRVIVSGRIVPKYDLFDRFNHIELCGIQDSELRSILSDLEDFETVINDEKLIEILKMPLFLNIYLDNYQSENRFNTRGEILDSYIMNWKDDILEGRVVKFIVQFLFPLICRRLNSNDLDNNMLTRAELLEDFDDAIELYINDEQVYQNMVASRKIKKESLLKSRERDDLIDLIINSTSFVEESYSKPHELHFTHQYYEDYFAAKHIMNVIEAVKIGYKKVYREDMDDYMRKYNLSEPWFNCFQGYPNENDSYRLLGEISGDYKNIACEDFDYKWTLLDDFLWLARSFDIGFAIRNIIRTMTISRNKVICGVDFSEMSMPYLLPTYAKFSMDGKYACNFSNSTVYKIPVFHFENNHSYGVSGNLMMIIFDRYGIVVLWDIKENRLIRSYSIFEDMVEVEIFFYIEISPNHKYADALSKFKILRLEIETGKIVEEIWFDTKEFKEMKKRFREKKDSIEKLDSDFLTEVVSQLNIFKGCDFSEATFLDKYEKEMLSKMGTICDFTEDKFIEGRQKKNTEDWIEIDELCCYYY